MLTPYLQTLPKHYRSLEKSSILIIGNGPSATDSDHGKLIDSFDQIIRINNYVTEGLEEQIGSRTDVWVNGANQGLVKRKDTPDNILVMIPPAVLEHKGDAIHDRIRRRLGTEQYFMLPIDIMEQMEQECSIDRPTTGFFTVYFFYLLGLDVTVHGFDFFVETTSHYFDSPLKRWLKDKGFIRKAGKHNVQGEKTFIEDLIRTKKIKQL